MKNKGRIEINKSALNQKSKPKKIAIDFMFPIWQYSHIKNSNAGGIQRIQS